MATEEAASVEQAAAARRERLRALRAAQELLTTPDDGPAQPTDGNLDDDAEEREYKVYGSIQGLCAGTNSSACLGLEKSALIGYVQETNPDMKFRNYVPHNEQLQKGKVAPPVLPKFEDPVEAAPTPTEKKEDPFVNIAPKKPNWDLRRDVQKKLDKLERRTQKAIYKLMEQQEKEKLMDEDDGRNVVED